MTMVSLSQKQRIALLLFCTATSIFIAISGSHGRELPAVFPVLSAVGLIVGFGTLVGLVELVLRPDPHSGARLTLAAVMSIGAWYLIYVSIGAAEGKVRLVPEEGHWAFYLLPIAVIISTAIQWSHRPRPQT